MNGHETGLAMARALGLPAGSAVVLLGFVHPTEGLAIGTTVEDSDPFNAELADGMIGAAARIRGTSEITTEELAGIERMKRGAR